MSAGRSSRQETVLAILDQGLSAGAGFLASVAIARWLTRDEFGAYGITVSLFSGLLAVHTALISEPALIFGPSRFATQFASYLSHLLHLHVRLCVAIGLLASVIVHYLARGAWAGARPALEATALVLAATALPMLGRRILYAQRRVDAAVIASTIQLLLALLLLAALRRSGHLNAVAVVLALALAALAAGLAAVAMARHHATAQDDPQPQINAPSLGDVWQLHADFGRWGLVSAGLTWANINLAVLALPLGGSLAAVGTLRAATNLIAPMIQLNGAVGVIRLPAFVRLRGTPALRPAIRRTALSLTALSFLAWAVLALVGEWVSSVLYKSRYPDILPLLLVLGALPAAEGLNFTFGSALRAIERPDVAVRMQLIGLLLGTLPGCWLAVRHGPIGAAAAILACSACTAVAQGVAVYRLTRNRPSSFSAAHPVSA